MTAPVEAEKELELDVLVILHNLIYKTSLKRDGRSISPADHYKCQEALIAIQALLDKAVLKAELKARTDTMRIYNKSFKEDGAKDG